MSWEAWGDDDAGRYDHLLEAGWWDSTQAEAVVDAVKALRAEPVYEGGDKANGISVRFLMRLAILENEAGMRAGSDPLVQEARAAFATEAP